MTERLQKFLSRAGVASRRHAEGLITAGRVAVNNARVTELGTKVDPEKDLVSVDGKMVSLPEEKAYFILYKPSGMVTTLEDPQGRPTVKDLLGEVGRRVFPVGRLDWDAEGALLFTDDGDLAHQLMHPSFQVPRTYLAKVKGVPDEVTLEKLRGGVRLEDGMATPVSVDVFEVAERNTWLKLVVSEGRPHLVKRLCAAIGHPVVRLFRPAQGGIGVDGLKPGELRALSAAEVERVREIAQGKSFPQPQLRLPPRRHGRSGDSEGEGAEPFEVAGKAPRPSSRAQPGKGGERRAFAGRGAPRGEWEKRGDGRSAERVWSPRTSAEGDERPRAERPSGGSRFGGGEGGGRRSFGKERAEPRGEARGFGGRAEGRGGFGPKRFGARDTGAKPFRRDEESPRGSRSFGGGRTARGEGPGGSGPERRPDRGGRVGSGASRGPRAFGADRAEGRASGPGRSGGGARFGAGRGGSAGRGPDREGAESRGPRSFGAGRAEGRASGPGRSGGGGRFGAERGGFAGRGPGREGAESRGPGSFGAGRADGRASGPGRAGGARFGAERGGSGGRGPGREGAAPRGPRSLGDRGPGRAEATGFGPKRPGVGGGRFGGERSAPRGEGRGFGSDRAGRSEGRGGFGPKRPGAGAGRGGPRTGPRSGGKFGTPAGRPSGGRKGGPGRGPGRGR